MSTQKKKLSNKLPELEPDRQWAIGASELAADPSLIEIPAQMGDFGLFFPHQLTLLAAREKIGKSSLASSEAVSVARKGYSVLWVSRDEGLDHTVRRLSLLVKDDWPIDSDGQDLLRVMYDWPQDWNELSAVVLQENPDVVLVDSLSSVITSLGVPIPDNSEGEKWHHLVNNFRGWNRPVCILHHATKPHEGRASTYRGSTGIGAAADLLIEMQATKQYSTLRTLHRSGRWVLPTIRLVWDGEEAGYRTLTLNEAAAENTAKELLLSWPHGFPGVDTTNVHSLADLEMRISHYAGKPENSIRIARQRLKREDPEAYAQLLSRTSLTDS